MNVDQWIDLEKIMDVNVLNHLSRLIEESRFTDQTNRSDYDTLRLKSCACNCECWHNVNTYYRLKQESGVMLKHYEIYQQSIRNIRDEYEVQYEKMRKENW